MSTEQNKVIARQHYEKTADLQAAFALVSPDVVFHALPGLPPTYEGWYQAHAMFLIGAAGDAEQPMQQLNLPTVDRAS